MRYLYLAAAAVIVSAPSVARDHHRARTVRPAVTTTVTAATNIPALQSTIKYTRTATGATGQGNYARATSKIVYDSANGSYTIRDTGSTAITSTFMPANIDAGASSTAFTVYKRGANETFRRYNVGATVQGIALTYIDYGHWRRTGAPAYGAGTGVNDTYLVWGTRTASADMPRIGGATYNTALDGTFVNKNGAYAVAGMGSLTANFAGGTIGYSSTATGTKEIGGTPLAFGTMTGTGTIAFGSSGFSGTGSVNGSGYRMDVNGNFFGPQAAEVGGLFRITGPDRGNGQGVIVGDRP